MFVKILALTASLVAAFSAASLQPAQASCLSFYLNGNPATTVSIPASSSIYLNTSSSMCQSTYFLSVQRSDQNWNRYGPEATKWLTFNDYNRYGFPRVNFNVKRFAEDRWFNFVPGQYYRIKLGTGGGSSWTDVTHLVQVL
jgi:hypothetical protein